MTNVQSGRMQRILIIVCIVLQSNQVLINLLLAWKRDLEFNIVAIESLFFINNIELTFIRIRMFLCHCNNTSTIKLYIIIISFSYTNTWMKFINNRFSRYTITSFPCTLLLEISCNYTCWITTLNNKSFHVSIQLLLIK